MTSRLTSYKYPFINPAVTGNNETWAESTASNISTTTAFDSSGNSSINFQLASNTSFIRAHQMYLAFTVNPLDNTGAPLTGAALAAIKTSKQGCSRIFNRITLRSGSTIIETLEYDDQVGQFYSTLPDTKRKWLKITEGYGTSDNVFAGGPVRFCMQLFSSLLGNDIALPLPIFAAGLQVELSIAGAENYFVGNDVTRYSVTNPVLRYCSITPDPSFVLALTSAVASGRSAWFPMNELRTFRIYGNGAGETTYNVAVGNVTSVDAVTFTHWDTTTYNNRANDRFSRFQDAGLKSWSIEANGVLNPSGNRRFGHGPRDLETLMVTLLSETGSVHTLDDAANIKSVTTGVSDFDAYRKECFRAGINFVSDSEMHSTGISMVGAANPNIVIQAAYDGNVPSTMVTYITVTLSVVMEVTGTLINIHRVFA